MTSCEIQCADCVEFMSGLSTGSVDLVILDPPYYKVLQEQWDQSFESEEEYLSWSRTYFGETYRVLREGGSLYFFGDLNRVVFLRLILYLRELLTYQNLIIWCKNKGITAVKKRYVHDTEGIGFFTKGKSYVFNQQKMSLPKLDGYLRYRKSDSDGDGIIRVGDLKAGGEAYKYHSCVKKGLRDEDIFININVPNKLCKDYWVDISNMHEKGKRQLKRTFSLAVKPEKLIERIVLTSSNAGDFVLDPFMGAGTTAVVAKRLGRNFVGCESNGEYIQLINERLGGLR